ncbi:hypothetical protein F8M41_004437 [Gigaspora margarita]|uniref:Uncharacterized protein n=1 Tax=Gigaspora margarita TaxID=4874 RepID=A0A8H4ERY2_GIGMA|nr:hypothetical protein F8M41_004437 [Gigaspora margarita]
MDKYLREVPSITALITSDSIYRIKRRNIKNQEEEEKDIRKRRNMRVEEERTNIDELHTLIKEQAKVITQIIKDQHDYTSKCNKGNMKNKWIFSKSSY